MVLHNTSAARAATDMLGETIILTTRADTPTYNAVTEVPDWGGGTSSELTVIEDPTETEIKNSGGKVTINSKKFIFKKGVTVKEGYKITIAGISNDFEIDELLSYNNRTVAFATENKP